MSSSFGLKDEDCNTLDYLHSILEGNHLGQVQITRHVPYSALLFCLLVIFLLFLALYVCVYMSGCDDDFKFIEKISHLFSLNFLNVVNSKHI